MSLGFKHSGPHFSVELDYTYLNRKDELRIARKHIVTAQEALEAFNEKRHKGDSHVLAEAIESLGWVWEYICPDGDPEKDGVIIPLPDGKAGDLYREAELGGAQ